MIVSMIFFYILIFMRGKWVILRFILILSLFFILSVFIYEFTGRWEYFWVILYIFSNVGYMGVDF